MLTSRSVSPIQSDANAGLNDVCKFVFSGGYQDLSDRSPSRDYSSGGQNDNFGGFGEDGRADRWKAHGLSLWGLG